MTEKNAWDGEERRSEDRSHDLLIRVDTNLSNFMQRFEEHTEMDQKHFERIYPAISDLKSFMWKWTGAIAAIGAMTAMVEFYVKFFKDN